jgi:starch phosphorylase
MNGDGKIAYFSMEMALDSRIPGYAGGLGVLAADTIRAAADLRVPMIGITLIHRKGYFHQRFDQSGWQMEEPSAWAVEELLEEMPARVHVEIEGRKVALRCWKYEVAGVGGQIVPVYLLDSDLPENSGADRTLSDYLYGGDERYRLCQEVILGIGGVRMLRALGYADIVRFHMNEGHSSLLTIELLKEEMERLETKEITSDVILAVKRKCVFTTHTPIPAGHEKFPLALVRRVVGANGMLDAMKNLICCGELLHLTFLALNLSGYVNGVAKRHGELSRLMFSGYEIDSITNGVHAATWTSPPFQALFDRYIPGWRQDNFALRHALSIPRRAVWNAHMESKTRLLDHVRREAGVDMDPSVLTLGFARRAAVYKRGDLLFENIERLKTIVGGAGPFQIVYAGKAHPRDQGGKELIQRIFRSKESLQSQIKIAYLENYDLELGKKFTSGVDIWLNTPQPPLEASGTSGMKAALNGVPSLSVLDGWWIEGHIEGVTGWSIGEIVREAGDGANPEDAASLYDKLELVVIPLFYQDRARFLEIMLHAVALNGSFFNTQRMLQEYVLKAYF